ncbi:MAG: hypothetical protein F4143_05620 [Gemmatimonadales bacterium]|nr:hypothetical protein [Gemmatimonadales bacterium]
MTDRTKKLGWLVLGAVLAVAAVIVGYAYYVSWTGTSADTVAHVRENAVLIGVSFLVLFGALVTSVIWLLVFAINRGISRSRVFAVGILVLVGLSINGVTTAMPAPAASPAPVQITGPDEDDCPGWLALLFRIFGEDCDEEDDCPEKPSKDIRYEHCTWD